jgi:hypothetical protein
MVMKKSISAVVLIIIFACISQFNIQAQIIKIDTVTKWKKNFKSAINLNQASFSSNWKSGGVNSLGFTTLLNYKANYKSDGRSWDNEIDLLYGMVKNAGQGYRKTLDRLFLDTKVGRNLGKHWDLYLSFNFQTQFAPGYKYSTDVNGASVASRISSFLAPGFFTTAVGFEYAPKPHFKMRLSPFAPRLTFVKNPENYTAVDPEKPYGVKLGEMIRYEWLSSQVQFEYNRDVMTNVNLKLRYLIFSNYENFNLKNTDQRMDINITAKVNKYINASISSILLYDRDQDEKLQLSQAFSLGFLYTFKNFK